MDGKKVGLCLMRAWSQEIWRLAVVFIHPQKNVKDDVMKYSIRIKDFHFQCMGFNDLFHY